MGDDTLGRATSRCELFFNKMTLSLILNPRQRSSEGLERAEGFG